MVLTVLFDGLSKRFKVTKDDIKDIARMLFISAVIIVALFVVNFVFFNEKKASIFMCGTVTGITF